VRPDQREIPELPVRLVPPVLPVRLALLGQQVRPEQPALLAIPEQLVRLVQQEIQEQ